MSVQSIRINLYINEMFNDDNCDVEATKYNYVVSLENSLKENFPLAAIEIDELKNTYGCGSGIKFIQCDSFEEIDQVRNKIEEIMSNLYQTQDIWVEKQ